MLQTIESTGGSLWTPEGAIRLLYQRRLPAEEVQAECRDVAAVAHAIRTKRIHYRDQCGSTHGASQG